MMRSPGTSASRSRAKSAISRSCATADSMPSPPSHRNAAAIPIAWAIAGVPASNRAGGSAQVVPALVTLRIIEPPPRNGGISRSSSCRAQSAPMPVGP